MKENKWVRLLAYVTGLINQELLLQNEYLASENRILRAHLSARLRLSDPERSTLAEIGKRLGRKALARVACVAKPDTILALPRTRTRGGLLDLADVKPPHVAAYIEVLGLPEPDGVGLSKPFGQAALRGAAHAA